MTEDYRSRMAERGRKEAKVETPPVNIKRYRIHKKRKSAGWLDIDEIVENYGSVFDC